MEPERIGLSQHERDRLKVLHEVEEGHLTQVLAAGRLRLTDRQVRRLLLRVQAEGDRGGDPPAARAALEPKNPGTDRAPGAGGVAPAARYAGFGPSLASEKLGAQGLGVSRETLRKWMTAAGANRFLEITFLPEWEEPLR